MKTVRLLTVKCRERDFYENKGARGTLITVCRSVFPDLDAQRSVSQELYPVQPYASPALYYVPYLVFDTEYWFTRNLDSLLWDLLVFNRSPEDVNIFMRQFQDNTKYFHRKSQMWKSKLQSFKYPYKVLFVMYSVHTLQVNQLIKFFKGNWTR